MLPAAKKRSKAAARKKGTRPVVRVRAEVALKKKMAVQKARLEILEAMEEIGRLLNSTLDEREVRRHAMQSATRLMRAEVGSLLLIDPETQELFFEVALGDKAETVREIRLRPGEGIAGWVAQTGEAQIVNDTRKNPHFFKSADEKSGFVTRNMICVPVKSHEKIVGVLQAINKKRGKFTEIDLEGFKSLADQVAIAIENAGLYRELKETFLSTAAALGDAIEAKDAYTAGHTKRVLEYSLVVGKRLGLSKEELDQLKLAAALHDIGKIGIEDRILGKPNRLEPEEAEMMERHTVIGAKIVENIRPLRAIVPGILHHHEKYDGKGYPDALKGGAIPTMARIISVCDTFDAITSDRPYRKGVHPEIALQELRKHSGTQFDPKIVGVFIAAYESGEIEPILHRNNPSAGAPSHFLSEKAPS